MSVKIALVADTRLTSPVEGLPEEVARQIAGVDLIPHAGVTPVSPGSPMHPRAGSVRAIGILEHNDGRVAAPIVALDNVDAVS